MSTRHATVQRLASFEEEWCPQSYLRDYYQEVENDERITMQFLTEAAAFVGDLPVLLEFGCGPTVHHLFPFAERAAEIHVADYLSDNLAEVVQWVNAAEGAHDWSPFAAYTLAAELGRPPTDWEVDARQSLTRERITTFLAADARRSPPLTIGEARPRYPGVLCCFCPDSITDDMDQWRACTANVASLVAPGGWLVLAALGHAASYRVGDLHFPSACVSPEAVADVLGDCGFSTLGTTVVSAHADDQSAHGFDSVVLAVSRKP